MTQLNPYATNRLSPEHLELLFPASFYQSDEQLSQHMSESCLVEQMTWDGDTAVGETAFWLKVLSTPESDYLKRQKRLFKLAIAERCRDISLTYSDPSSNKPPAIIKLKVSDPDQSYQARAQTTVQKVMDIQTLPASPGRSREPQILVRTTTDANSTSSPGVIVEGGDDASNTPTATAIQTQVVVDQVISDNDWQVIEKHMSVSIREAGGAAQAVEGVDDMDTYDSPTPGFGIKTFRCKLCPFAADNRPALNKHQKLSHYDQLPYSCDQCDYTSKYSWSIKTHIDSVHLKSKRFRCSDCGYATSQACFLRRHTLRVHNTEEGAHKCPYCDYSAHHQNSLQRHVNRQHTHNFAHKCPYCDFGRDCKYLVEDHINDVHLKKVIYQCSECSYQTYKQRSLKSHHKTHLSRDVMKCSECDYKSVSMAGLSRHMKAEHPDTDAKAVLANIKRNVQTTSTVKSDGDDYTAVLMGKCKFCDYATDNVMRLKSHIRTKHKKVKKVPCPHCLFKATNRNGLRRHLTNQHPEKQVLDLQPPATASEGQATEAVTLGVGEAIDNSQVTADSLPVVTMVDGESSNIVTVLMTGVEAPETTQS